MKRKKNRPKWTSASPKLEAKLGREREWPEVNDLELEINGDYDSPYALEQKS